MLEVGEDGTKGGDWQGQGMGRDQHRVRGITYTQGLLMYIYSANVALISLHSDAV